MEYSEKLVSVVAGLKKAERGARLVTAFLEAISGEVEAVKAQGGYVSDLEHLTDEGYQYARLVENLLSAIAFEAFEKEE